MVTGGSMRRVLLAALSASLLAAAMVAAPASAASFTATVADTVSGKPTTLSLALDGSDKNELNIGITSLSLQLPAGIEVNPGPASACTAAMLGMSTLAPECTSAQVGAGTGNMSGIGITFAEDSVTAAAYRDPGGQSLNVLVHVRKAGVDVSFVIPVTVKSSAAGSLLGFTMPRAQLSETEFLSLRKLSIALGSAAAGSVITTSSCKGSWDFSGSVMTGVITATAVTGAVTTPLAASQPCTQGAAPPPSGGGTTKPLPDFTPAFTFAKGGALGQLVAVGGFKGLSDGVSVGVRCVAGCSPGKLGSVKLKSSTLKSAKLRFSKAVTLKTGTRIEVDVTKSGSVGRYTVYGFSGKSTKLVVKKVKSGCLTPAGAHTGC